MTSLGKVDALRIVGPVRFPPIPIACLLFAGCASETIRPAEEPPTFAVTLDLDRVPPAHQPTARALLQAAAALETGDREAAGASLLIAAAGSPQPHLASHLRAAHRTWMSKAGHAELEATLLATTDEPLIAPFWAAPGEPLNSIQVGLVQGREQVPVDHLLANLNAFEEWLGRGNDQPHAATDRVVIARLLGRAGSVAPTAVHTRAPAGPTRGEEAGSVSVLWRTMLHELRWKANVEVTAAHILAPTAAVRVTPNAHLRWHAARFATFQVGPSLDGETFGDVASSLMNAKASTLAALARVWLAQEGEVAPSEKGDALCTWVAMALQTLVDADRGYATPLEKKAAQLVLAWLFERQAIVLNEGRVVVRITATLAAGHALVEELAIVAVQRDVGRARALLKQSETLPDVVETAIEELAAREVVAPVPVFGEMSR